MRQVKFRARLTTAALLCMLAAVIGLRALHAQTPPPAGCEESAAPTAAPAAELPLRTEPPEETAASAPADTPEPTAFVRPQGYTAESYQLVSDLVYTWAALGEEGAAQCAALLERLRQSDPALAALWGDILDYWRYANSELPIVPGAVPEGLSEDESLCIVVLGFQLHQDGSMADELLGRCETALECLRRYPRALLAVTGGGTASMNREATEAGVMAAWFEERGVDPARIMVEDRSLTTADNAVFTGELLRERHPEVKELLIVSSDYHLPLGCLLFEETALLCRWSTGVKPYAVAACAAWDSGGHTRPDSPMMQKSYVWSVADPRV